MEKSEPSGNQGKHKHSAAHKIIAATYKRSDLPTTRVTLDNRPISRGRFRSSLEACRVRNTAVSTRRARTAIGSGSRSKLVDSQMFTAGSRMRARPSTSGGR